MGWESKYESDGLEFDIEDRFVEVDELFAEKPKRRRWADEKKPAPEPGPFPDSRVGGQRSRAYAKGLPSDLSDAEWRRWCRAFDKCCAYCGTPKSDPIIDHVVPVALNGGTTICNVLPACFTCNSKKRDMPPERWLGIIGWEGFLTRLATALERMNEKA